MCFLFLDPAKASVLFVRSVVYTEKLSGIFLCLEAMGMILDLGFVLMGRKFFRQKKIIQHYLLT